MELSPDTLALGELAPAASHLPNVLPNVSMPFFGQRKAGSRKWEQPWHRHAAYHFAMGLSQKEVALACDCSPVTIAQLMREKWFQQNIVEIMAEHSGHDVMDMIKAEAINSLATLIELRDLPTTSPTVKANIAMDLLNRHLGKPTQRVETVGAPSSADPVAEAERLERENSRLST